MLDMHGKTLNSYDHACHWQDVSTQVGQYQVGQPQMFKGVNSDFGPWKCQAVSFWFLIDAN